MLTSQEGEGWQQLGEGIAPTSERSAATMMDGFNKIGDQALHSAFGGSSLPDLKDALGAMYGPEPTQLNSAVQQLPQLDFFDSSAAATAPSGTGFESAGLQQAPATGFETSGLQSASPSSFFEPTGASPTGFESSGLQASIQPGATGMEGSLQAAPAGFESSGMQASLQTGPSAFFEPTGMDSGLQGMQMGPGGAPAAGFESAGIQAPGGTIETLHAPGMGQAIGAPNAPGVESFNVQTPGADASAGLSDASSPFANIGKAFTDVMSKMGDMLGGMAQGPMGLLGGLLNFFLTVFSEILSNIGQAIEETVKAAASASAELWKKHLEMTA